MFKNFFPKSKDGKFRFVFYFLLFLFLVGTGIFGFGHQSAAKDEVLGFLNLWTKADDAIAALVGWFVTLIIHFLGLFLILVINILILVAQYNNFINSTAVTNGWVIIRDVANMGFIVVLLVIAFSTVLGIEQYSWKKMLGRVLIMAVLINFSKMICGLFIDFSQVIMLTFVNGFKETAGLDFVEFLGIRKWTELDWDAAKKTGLSPWNATISYLLALLMSIIAVVTIGIMLVVLIARIVALWILVVLSPIAYIAHVVPGGEKYASQWWQSFTKYLIVGPALAFFIWLSLSMASQLGKEEIRKEMDLPEANKLGKERKRIEELRVGETQIGTTENMLSYIIAISMLIAGLMVTQSLGVAGSKIAGSAVGKMQGIATGALKKYTGARWVQERWGAYRSRREAIRKEKVERAGEKLSVLRDAIAPTKLMSRIFRGKWRPPGVKEADRRRAEHFEKEISRDEKVENIEGISFEKRRKMLSSGKASIRVAAAMAIIRKGEMSQLDKKEIFQLREIRETLHQRGTGETAQRFDEILIKTAPETALEVVYNNLAMPENQKRYQADIISGKALSTLSVLNKKLVDKLGDRFSQIGTQYVKTKDSAEIKALLEKLPEKLHDAFLRGVSAEIFAGNQEKQYAFANVSGRQDLAFRDKNGELVKVCDDKGRVLRDAKGREITQIKAYLDDSRNRSYIVADRIAEETLRDEDIMREIFSNKNYGTSNFAEFAKDSGKRTAIEDTMQGLKGKISYDKKNKEDMRLLKRVTAATSGRNIVDHFEKQPQYFADLLGEGEIKAEWLENMEHDPAEKEGFIDAIARTRDIALVIRIAGVNHEVAQSIAEKMYADSGLPKQIKERMERNDTIVSLLRKSLQRPTLLRP